MGVEQDFLTELETIRRELHRKPELSGQEIGTAETLRNFLQSCGPTAILGQLGGHGLAAVFEAPSGQKGPKVMLRAELDALPLAETLNCAWPSEVAGCAHKCGHDGHMAILMGVARRLQQTPLVSGSVTLLFQPAEETGTGAATLLTDPQFQALKPDWIFALHNLPGYPAWSILTRKGAFAAGSAGIKINLTGSTSHAAFPEQGTNPDQALAALVLNLVNLGDHHPDQLTLVTVVHARLGSPSFGTSPADAEVLATIRAQDDCVLQQVKKSAADLARRTAADHGLGCAIEFCEEFPVTMNDSAAVDIIWKAARQLELDVISPAESPFRWSEDFGVLTTWARGAMFGLGAGLHHPVLHGPDYDFNDDLLLPGLTILEKICRILTEQPPIPTILDKNTPT